MNIPDWVNRISFGSDKLLKHISTAIYYGVVLVCIVEIYHMEKFVRKV